MPGEVLRLGEFELDARAFELRRSGRAVRLERIPLELLFFLAERRGELVSRDEILDRIWGKDVFVDADNSINTAVRKVRAALNDDSEKPKFLRTVPGKGYKLAIEQDALLAPVKTPPAKPTADANPTLATPGAAGQRGHWAIWAGLAVVLAAVMLVAVPRFLRPRNNSAPGKVKLVVLPFVNLSNDPQQEYFADGMTEEIITQLGGLDPQRLGVIARTSSMQYKAAHKDAAQIARELGVNYLLEGSVRREGGRVRVTAQLIQATDQMHVWAGDFDRDESDILKLQGDLALAISQKTALSLSSATRARLAEAVPLNPEAHQAYLSGLQAWSTRSKPGALRSITEYQRAISLEPSYAQPYAALANVLSLASVVGAMSAQEAMPKAKEAALRAIGLDDSLATGHTALGFIAAHYDFDWPKAEREFRRALELNPNDSAAHFFYSNSYLSPMGRHDEAIAEMKRAIELDPFSAPMQSFFGQTLLWARKYDEALAQYKKCAELFPGFAIDHERMAHLYTYMGRYDDAIAEDTQAKLLAGETPEAALREEQKIRKALASEGPRGYWKTLLEFSRLPEGPPESYKNAQHLAIIYTRLGQTENALTSLERAYDTRTIGLTELAIEPAFDPLHSEPRFQTLSQRLGLQASLQ